MLVFAAAIGPVRLAVLIRAALASVAAPPALLQPSERRHSLYVASRIDDLKAKRFKYFETIS